MGESAGGNLATLAAYTAAAPIPADAVPATCPTTPVTVRAVIDGCGPVDLPSANRGTASTVVPGMFADYLGGTPDQHPDRARRVSATTYIRPGLPPTLIMHGKHDDVVPYSQAELLDQRLTAAGIQHQLVGLPATNHGIFGFARQIALHAMDEFLTAHVGS